MGIIVDHGFARCPYKLQCMGQETEDPVAECRVLGPGVWLEFWCIDMKGSGESLEDDRKN